jgi:hypothetical protein
MEARMIITHHAERQKLSDFVNGHGLTSRMLRGTLTQPIFEKLAAAGAEVISLRSYKFPAMPGLAGEPRSAQSLDLEIDLCIPDDVLFASAQDAINGLEDWHKEAVESMIEEGDDIGLKVLRISSEW